VVVLWFYMEQKPVSNTGPLGLLFVYSVTTKLCYIVYVTVFFLSNIYSKEFYEEFLHCNR